jgi:hypothetical protein
MNGRMTKNCGLSFKGCNRILVHQIHLYGKMIHYGTKIAECLVFQQNKVETIKTPGILQPLAIPSEHWEEVSMDFITWLPKSEGKSVITVIVDRLTKYTHFCALSHPC